MPAMLVDGEVIVDKVQVRYVVPILIDTLVCLPMGNIAKEITSFADLLHG